MRTRTLHAVIAVGAMLMMVPAQALAQNLVRGTVKDYKDQPVEGALIHFEAIEFVNKRDTKTDKKGEYIFQGLTSGEYNVTASKAGVGTHTRKYNVTAQSMKERLDFSLVPDRAVLEANAKAEAAKVAPPSGVESLNADAGVKGKELEALRAIAMAAVEAQKAGKHEEAAAKFTELVGKVPNCSDCYIQLGVTYYELQKYDEAVDAFKKSIAARPSVEAWTALARIYNNQKKLELAADAAKNASDLANKPPDPPPGTAPAGGSGAASTAPKVITSGAASETLYNQGVILWNAGKYAEAKTQFEAAVKANPSNPEALYQLGMANLNLGQIPAARSAFETYLKVAPNGPKAGELKTYLTQLPKQ